MNLPRPATPLPGRPGGDRPSVTPPIAQRPSRPGIDRPIRPGNPNGPRPERPNLTPGQIDRVKDKWQNALARPGNKLPPSDHWHNWAGNVHDHWHGHTRPWFNDHWWHNHPNCGLWWGAHYYNRPWGYWWGVPTWAALTGFMVGGAWAQPVYYDYGTNVVYQNDTVYVNDQPVASGVEYAATAGQLAATPIPATQEAKDKTEWMPLGVFALSLSADEKDSPRMLQLAVSKDGLISGVYYNTEADKAVPIQGAVDRTTQRACWTVGDNKDAVFDTGIYNLTQDETPVLVHHGADKTDSYLMVRMQKPEDAPAK